MTAFQKAKLLRKIKFFLRIEKRLARFFPLKARVESMVQIMSGMLSQKCSRHETLHLLMAILIQLLYPVMKGAAHFPWILTSTFEEI